MFCSDDFVIDVYLFIYMFICTKLYKELIAIYFESLSTKLVTKSIKQDIVFFSISAPLLIFCFTLDFESLFALTEPVTLVIFLWLRLFAQLLNK